MNPILVAVTSLVCIFGGTLLGLALRRFLPDDHLNSDSKDAVKVGAGMISMMAALVLGLLVSSAKNNFDDTTKAVTQSGARVIVLDRVLASYGNACADIRADLRKAVAANIELLWPEEGSADSGLAVFERRSAVEKLLERVRNLDPQTETQRALRSQAMDIINEMMLTRWIQIEQAQVTLPQPFLVILLFWLTMLYTSFGLLAPRNLTVICMMFIGALALATALFLIIEMNTPMQGTIKVSSGPMRKALQYLGR